MILVQLNMRKTLLSLVGSLIAVASWAQVQSPAEFLGYELGEQFSRHYQVVDYFQQVAENSDLVNLKQYGKTYEMRPLYLAYVSTPENLARLEQIREDNLKRAGLLDGEPSSDVSVVWLSYNVHGNESVSTEASMATIYELITNKKDWLKNTVVIIDPCVNPDGRERYVNFYWEHKNAPYNPDPNSWEHHEPWPGGRANHYLFDLNRDWAWGTQTETQQRIAVFNKWLPQVHVDFHEQGVNSPYYFAPAAEPVHEFITDWQMDFQTQIGKNHAKYFDQNDWFYFTKQVFDLLYPSYGDTYPTYNGSIGMTYEQGGSGRAGLGIIKQEEDTLTLADRIAHHYTTGISTVEISSKNSSELLSQFKTFFSKPAASKYKTFVLKSDGDEDRMKALTKWLDVQGIQYGTASSSKALSGYHYGSGATKSFSIGKNDLVVNINQPKSVLTTILFEPKTKLNDSLTYDITSWAIPYAYGFEAFATTADVRPSGELSLSTFEDNSLSPAYAYIFDWKGLDDAKLLAAILKKDLKVRYTTRPITIDSKTFGRGSIIISQRDNGAGYHETLEELSNEFERTLYPVNSGFVMDGPDIGSGDVPYLKTPKVALIGGSGTSSLDFGATWHYMEQNLGYPVTTINTEYFGGVDLGDYDVLIMPNGWYSDFSERTVTKVKEWVQSGGTLIAVQGAIKKLKSGDLGSIDNFNSPKEKTDFEKIDEGVEEEKKLVPNSELERFEIREYVAGAVFKVAMDNTSPLAYGYKKDYYSLKTSRDRYGYLDAGNVGVIKSADDHLSGFAGEIVKKKVGTSLVFGQERMGRGTIVYMVDNPLFRSFWYDGKLLFANAIFFAGN